MDQPPRSGGGNNGCGGRRDNNNRLGGGGGSNINDHDDIVMNNIPLIHLPLRPSSLKLLQQAGFVTSREVIQAKRDCNSMITFAAELSMSVPQAMSIYREVVETTSSLSCRRQVNDDDDDENNDNSSNRPVLQQQHQHNNKRPLSSSSSSAAACSTSTSALSLLQNHGGGVNIAAGNSSVEAIVTFCRPLDQLLGGGICLQELTEICGKPGTGKTQLAMQLAVDARLPLPVGGVAGECIYVDTEGSFIPERCYTLACALVQHVHAGQQKKKKQQLQLLQLQQGQPSAAATVINSSNMPPWFTPESILQGIHVFRVHDVAAQTATLFGAIPQLLQQRQEAGSPIRLIIIDSIAFHYRAAAAAASSTTTTNSSSNSDFMDRTRQLTRVASHLAELAMSFKVAVVALNQMTTKVVAQSAAGGDNYKNSTSTAAMDRHVVVPALGEAWAHAVTTRLLLVNHNDEAPDGAAAAATTAGGSGAVLQRRSCQLIKSPRLPPGRAFFQVCESGIRGLDFEKRRHHDDEQQQQQQQNQTGNNNSNNTRNAPYNQTYAL